MYEYRNAGAELGGGGTGGVQPASRSAPEHDPCITSEQ